MRMPQEMMTTSKVFGPFAKASNRNFDIISTFLVSDMIL